MGPLKEIIIIVRYLKWRSAKMRLNNNYRDKFRLSYNEEGDRVIYKGESNNHILNYRYRDLCNEYYMHVFCFLTGKNTKYKLPKNY